MSKYELEVIIAIEAFVEDREKALEMMGGFMETNQQFVERMAEAKILTDVNFEHSISVVEPTHQDPFVVPDLHMVKQSVIKQIHESYYKLRKTVDTDLYRTNDYMRGMFNASEAFMSILEERDPIFLNENGEFYRGRKSIE